MKKVIIDGKEFQAVREDLYVPAANNVEHIYKKGWQLYYRGFVVLSGYPKARYNYRAAEVVYPTFADLATEWDDEIGVQQILHRAAKIDANI